MRGFLCRRGGRRRGGRASEMYDVKDAYELIGRRMHLVYPLDNRTPRLHGFVIFVVERYGA